MITGALAGASPHSKVVVFSSGCRPERVIPSALATMATLRFITAYTQDEAERRGYHLTAVQPLLAPPTDSVDRRSGAYSARRGQLPCPAMPRTRAGQERLL